ncbi:MAG: glycine betaine/L-proline ABC transporter ATP-binding protein [Acidimicrobiia bacterium]|nr:glycine betaine/L-proline ABC transporter ATP-binding protein [Acidimicrobiia bacterium]
MPDFAHANSVLTAEGLWKVFGPKPARALELASEGQDRLSILQQTGCTVGVKDVSFEVKQGEVFVVMGLSGSGKSTLIRCVSRLTEATQGRVTLFGDDFTAMDANELREVRRKKLSMVFQHFGLLPHRKVIDNVAYGLEVQGLPKAERHAKAMEVLSTVGLEGYEQHYPQQLSGGMQQRVGLARALTVDPEILFFDEPFSALDPLIRRDMQEELIRLQESMHRTLVFITHDFAEAIKLGDRIAIMKEGGFDQVGTAAELITSPKTDYVREFTKDIPKAKVLCARDVMSSDTSGEGRQVHEGDTVEMLVPMLLSDPGGLIVVDDERRRIGRIDRAAVSAVLDISQ